jgi:hypothetical protein
MISLPALGISLLQVEHLLYQHHWITDSNRQDVYVLSVTGFIQATDHGMFQLRID